MTGFQPEIKSSWCPNRISRLNCSQYNTVNCNAIRKYILRKFSPLINCFKQCFCQWLGTALYNSKPLFCCRYHLKLLNIFFQFPCHVPKWISDGEQVKGSAYMLFFWKIVSIVPKKNEDTITVTYLNCLGPELCRNFKWGVQPWSSGSVWWGLLLPCRKIRQ